MEKKKILIIAISPAEEGLFLPLIYGNLRSYADQFPEIRESYEWLDPVILPDDAVSLPAADIYAASIYSWNAVFSFELLRDLKALHSGCITLAGGPEVDWKDRNFFNDHPYMDAVIPGDGEIPFSNFLRSLLASPSLANIDGILASPAAGPSVYRPSASPDLRTKPSSWLSLRDFWIRYAARYSDFRLAACLETSRGCPYNCTYCDWGGQCKGRINAVTDETAIMEMDFLQSEIRPFFMFWTDGNLGILKRDAALSEHFAYNRKKYGFPISLYYNCNKDNFDSNLKIADNFRKAGLLTKYVLALQHTDPVVLRNIGRTNLPADKQKLIADHMKKNDISLYVQFILGCPGDCFDKWLRAYCELMEMGIHGEYRAYPFGLFPNSAASDPEYMEKWQIYAPLRVNYVPFFTLKKPEISYALSSSRYVLSSKGMSLDNYADMLKLSLLISACHDHGLTRHIAIYLHDHCGWSYEDFYRRLFNVLSGKACFNVAEAFAERWINCDDAAFVIKSKYTGTMLEPEEELVFSLYEHYDEFYALIGDALDIPEDLIIYQKAVLYRPEDQPHFGSVAELPGEIAEFFDPSLGSSGQVVEINKRVHFPKPWYDAEDSLSRNRRFYSQIIHHNIPGAVRSAFRAFEKVK